MMPSVSCLAAITYTIAQGIDQVQQHRPFSRADKPAAQGTAQDAFPVDKPEEPGIRRRGWQHFAHFLHINRQASGTIPRSSDIRPAEIASQDKGVSLGSMRACVAAALVAPQPGEQPELLDDVWAKIYQFDAQRRSAGDRFDLAQDFPELNAIAANGMHASNPDATLLRDVMTRPVGPDTPSLEEYLAKKVEAGLDLYMEILPNPDFRTFNSMQPGLATSTLDYHSAGRTLLLKGAAHLIGIPGSPAVMDGQLTEAQLDRKGRLQKTMLSFPKLPEPGVERLKLSDFDAMIDPLDNLNVYESSGPQLP